MASHWFWGYVPSLCYPQGFFGFSYLALDRVKSISALSAHWAVLGLMGTFDVVNPLPSKRFPIDE